MPITTQQQWSPNTMIHCFNKQQIQVHLLYTFCIRNTCVYIWWVWKYFEKVTEQQQQRRENKRLPSSPFPQNVGLCLYWLISGRVLSLKRGFHIHLLKGEMPMHFPKNLSLKQTGQARFCTPQIQEWQPLHHRQNKAGRHWKLSQCLEISGYNSAASGKPISP